MHDAPIFRLKMFKGKVRKFLIVCVRYTPQEEHTGLPRHDEQIRSPLVHWKYNIIMIQQWN